jgi:hypothetical protein
LPKQPKKSPAPEPRPEQGRGDGSVGHSESDQTHEEILAYWTPQRMADAKPRELRLPEPVPPPADGGPDESADPAPDPS